MATRRRPHHRSAAAIFAAALVVLLAAATGLAPTAGAPITPGACTTTKTCKCVYPPGLAHDTPDNVCSVRRCVTCTCARGFECSTALVLTQVGVGPDGANVAASAVVLPTPAPTSTPTPTPTLVPSSSPRRGGRVTGCLPPGTPCGFPGSSGCCGGAKCVRDGPFRMCEDL
eukprot:TRINITY_DN1030_c0_g1_i1.p2 TRINITY_DN1030_c0_g1~~TRINITY_DN1030_c0_g1_i1.p2  ORF type:complete len:171 (+),score=30.77 TRINITY_DN1030_c0_g1_i1:569-1081(+)